MKILSVTNYAKWQRHCNNPQWAAISIKTFEDKHVKAACESRTAQKLGWVAIILAARACANEIVIEPGETPERKILGLTGLVLDTGPGRGFDIEPFVRLGLVEINDADVKPKVIVPEKAYVPKQPKAVEERALYDTPENRQCIDDLNRILGRNLGHTVILLKAANTLRAAGYGPEKWCEVFSKVAAAPEYSPTSARGISSWIKAHFKPEYLLRVGDRGGFEQVLNEEAQVGPKLLPYQQGQKSDVDLFEEMRARYAEKG